jgi:hypothetical protein
MLANFFIGTHGDPLATVQRILLRTVFLFVRQQIEKELDENLD